MTQLLEEADRTFLAAATLEQWRVHRELFCRMTLNPERIRTGS